MADHKREKVKILIEKFENHMTIDVHPHGSHVLPAETERDPDSLDYSMTTRDSHRGDPLVCSRSFQPRETTVARGRLMTTDQYTQPPHQPNYTNSKLTTDESKEILCLNIPLLELRSATLEYIDEDRDTRDPGIYVKSVIHRGEAGEADCLDVHDQLTKVNGVSLTGLSKGPAMNMLHKAMQLDGPIYGHIQLVVVRKDISSVTHVDNADDFVYGPNNQTFRETHHAKYSTTRDISSPESHRPNYFDSGDNMTNNLPININVRQHDYHHASFQHKPMQKSDFRIDSNAMMQKEFKETESLQGSRQKSNTSSLSPHTDNIRGEEGWPQRGIPDFNRMDDDTHHTKRSPTKDIPSPVSYLPNYVNEETVPKKFPTNDSNSYSDEQVDNPSYYDQDEGFCNQSYDQVRLDRNNGMSKPTFPHKHIQQSTFCESPNVAQMGQMRMRSSSLPPDSYHPRSEVLEQQPELLSWEDSGAHNKMESCQRMGSTIDTFSPGSNVPCSGILDHQLEWSQQGIKGPLLNPEMSDVSSLKYFKSLGFGQQSTTEKETDHVELDRSEIYQREKSNQQQVLRVPSMNVKEIRIVMLGKTGTGKSATANTILGEKLFESSASAASITGKCKQNSSIRFGYKIVIVDTPGSFDTSHSNEYIQEEISKCVVITCPGPHAFILVLNASRFTLEEQHSISHFVRHFGEGIFKFMIILFTRKDDLDEENKSIDEFIKTSPQELRQFINRCGRRCIAFNNRLKEKEQDVQAKALLDLILENVKRNDEEHYTNAMYKEAEKILKEKKEEMERKAIEEHERELQALEERIEKKYKIKFAEDAKKLQDTQEQLEMLKQDKKENEGRLSSLTKQVKAVFKLLTGSKNEEKEELQKKLDKHQKEIEKVNKMVLEREQTIAKLEKSKEKANEDYIELKAKQEKDLKKYTDMLTKKLAKEIDEHDDALRKKIEESNNVSSMFGNLFNWTKDKVLGYLGY